LTIQFEIGGFLHLAGAIHSVEWLLLAVQKTDFVIFYRFIYRFGLLAVLFYDNSVTWCFGKNHTPKMLCVNAMRW
jgi:hypothetical protein